VQQLRPFQNHTSMSIWTAILFVQCLWRLP
jgi:hypothetical protein